MEDREIRAALDLHWAASDANDFEVEHQIYREDAVLEYPQSGERIRGRRNIQASRFAQPSKKRFTVRRILGAADQSARLIENFPDCYAFMRVSRDSHSPLALPEEGRRPYVAVQERRAFQRGLPGV